MAARIELRTERLVLRPFQTGDVADALAYRDDQQFARFLSHIPQPFTRPDAEAFVRLNMSEPWNKSPTIAVVLGGRVIGTVNLEVNPQTRTAMLTTLWSTWKKKSWGNGRSASCLTNRS